MSYTFLFLSLCVSALSAMEQTRTFHLELPREDAHTLLRVFNDTNDKLLVCLGFKIDGKFAHQTLIPGQHLDIESCASLSLLQAKPYGRFKEYLSAETFFVGLPNLVECLDLARYKCPSVKVTIRPYDNAKDVKGLGYYIAWLKETFVHYVCEAQPFDILDLKEYRTILDAFPQTEMLTQGSSYEPRYFLNLPEKATQEDIVFAYVHLKRLWENKKQSRDIALSNFATDVLAIVQTACDALLDQTQGESFKRLLQGYKAKNYIVMPDVYTPINLILGNDSKEVLEARSLPLAAQAMSRLALQNVSLMNLIFKRPETVELLIRYLSQKHLQSQTIETQTQAAFALETQWAQFWLIHKIKTCSEWRTNNYFVLSVFHSCLLDFFKPIINELVRYESINMLDINDNTPLNNALLKGHFALANLLIESGALCYVPNREHKTALDIAQARASANKGLPAEKEFAAVAAKIKAVVLQYPLIGSYYRKPAGISKKSGQDN